MDAVSALVQSCHAQHLATVEGFMTGINPGRGGGDKDKDRQSRTKSKVRPKAMMQRKIREKKMKSYSNSP